LDFRHEWKHEISHADRIVIRQRLRAIAKPDNHSRDGCYHVRSLYFDTPEDRALREKLDGVSRREKFRIRFYNGDTSLIHLEKKSKLAGLGSKELASLSAGEAATLVAGDREWMRDCDRPLVRELYVKMKQQGLRPKTIVDYTREAYFYEPGNVRVTLDYDIRTGLSCTDFLNPDCIMIPAGNAPVVLEVKWDSFLPDIIRDVVQLGNRRSGSFSKYAACRIYG